ncbi:hypothetical protein ACWCP8_38820 [Streptomyces sp. NPDC002206]
MSDFRYKMIMGLSAADIGSPLCESIASICAEVAERHYAELAEGQGEPGATNPAPLEELHPSGPPLTDVTVVDVSAEVLAGSAHPHVTVGEEHLS